MLLGLIRVYYVDKVYGLIRVCWLKFPCPNVNFPAIKKPGASLNPETIETS